MVMSSYDMLTYGICILCHVTVFFFVLFLFSKIDAVVTNLEPDVGPLGWGLAESVQMSQVWGVSQPRYAKGGMFQIYPLVI